MWSIIWKQKGTTHMLLLTLLLFLLGTAGLFVVSQLLFVLLPVFKHVEFRTGAGVLSACYLILQAAITIGICIRYIRPFYKMDCTVFEAYERIADERPSVLDARKADICEIMDLVIIQQKDSRNRELTANLLRHKAELSQLQSQINPHFLYNTLESIRGLALMRNVPEIAGMLESLSQIFRNNTRKIGLLVPLSDEIKNVDHYILIQKFRFQNRFSFEKIIAKGEYDLMKCMIPNFIIQPILENAITHGLEDKPSGGKIILSINATQSRLIMRAEDNGAGIPDEKLRELISLLNNEHAAEISDGVHVGIGIININQRIKMQYGSEYGLSIASTEGIGTQVEITLPL